MTLIDRSFPSSPSASQILENFFLINSFALCRLKLTNGYPVPVQCYKRKNRLMK